MHLAKYGVVVELRKNLVAISQDVDTLTATVGFLESGATESQETIVTQYLVGADGAKGVFSKVSSI